MTANTYIAKTFFLTLFSVFIFVNSTNANTNNDLLQAAEVKNQTGPSEEQEIVRSEKAQIHYDEIKEVLAREQFGKTEYKKAWRKIDTSDKEKRKDKFPQWLIKFFEWLESRESSSDSDSGFSLVGLASIIEVVFWLLAIGLVAFILVKYHKDIRSIATLLRSRKSNTQSLPTTMFGLDIKKESLPEDIIGTAEKHWNNGEVRPAIAILLRASLIKLLNEHECRFYDSDTEAECCLRIDKQAPKALSQFMRSLVSVWQQVAYAHRSPSQDKFDTLCAQWQEVF